MLSFSLRLPSLLPLFSPRLDDPFYSDSARDDRCRSSYTPPQPSGRATHVMNAAASKMNLNFAFALQVFRIELNFMILLFPLGLDQERIA